MAPSDPVLHLSLPVDDLAAARRFYEDAFGCSVGRVRQDWIDVWFFGMQLTLQHRPAEVRSPEDQGVRHFGVVLSDAESYQALIDRLRAADVVWISEPEVHSSTSTCTSRSRRLDRPAASTASATPARAVR